MKQSKPEVRCLKFACVTTSIIKIHKILHNQHWEAPKRLPAPWNNITDHGAVYSYMSRTPRDVCIVNTGMHSMAGNVTTKTYTHNVRKYLKNLQPFCRQMIWLSITSVLVTLCIDKGTR